MSIPDFQSLMLPVLRHLAQRRWLVSDLVKAVSDDHGLTDEERRQLLPSGRQATIANRTYWALAYLNRAGLIARISRGEYEATEDGRQVLTNPPDRITIGYLNRFPSFAGFRTRNTIDSVEPVGPTPPPDLPAQVATPEERLELADYDLKSDIAETLLNRMRTMSPSAFEQLIIDLLVGIGYGGTHREAAERLGRSGDGGVDGVIREDKLGLDAIYIQAKRYGEETSVGAPAVQAFAGALLGKGATKGVFVTTSHFTQHAKDVAEAYKTHKIVLIDGPELARLMIEHEIGVKTVQVIRVQRVDLEAYEDAIVP
jgi:restriction system protein